MEERVPARLSPAEGRKFAFTVGAAFLLLAAVAWYRRHLALLAVFGMPGAAFLLAGLAVPARLAPVWRLWMGLARAISKVTTPMFMALVYFLVFTPFGAVKRWAGHNALRRPAGASGYWVKRDSGTASDLERQF
jgi:hypothetical protein